MQAERHAAILQQQFVAPAARINRRFAVMQDDKARRVRGRLQPKRNRERAGAVEVADRAEGEAVLAAQFHGLSCLSGYERRFLVRAREVGSGEVRHLVREHFIEGKVRDESGDFRVGGGR